MCISGIPVVANHKLWSWKRHALLFHAKLMQICHGQQSHQWNTKKWHAFVLAKQEETQWDILWLACFFQINALSSNIYLAKSYKQKVCCTFFFSKMIFVAYFCLMNPRNNQVNLLSTEYILIMNTNVITQTVILFRNDFEWKYKTQVFFGIMYLSPAVGE